MTARAQGGGNPAAELHRAGALVAELRAERELTRQQARDLHEKAQAAREAQRELATAIKAAREWSTGLLEAVERRIADLLNTRVLELNDHLAKGMDEIDAEIARAFTYLAEVSQMVTRTQCEAAGLPDRDLTLQRVMVQVSNIAREVLNSEEFRDDLALAITTIQAGGAGPRLNANIEFRAERA